MEAPTQAQMGGDIFQGANRIMVNQEFAVMELFGCEAKNRYRVSAPQGDQEGATFLYIDEKSECFERLCCSTNRSLTLDVHEGATKDGPVVQSMHKPFHLQGNWCCCRPHLDVSDGQSNPIGTVDDPWACCVMNQKLHSKDGKPLFTTSGSVWQLGMCCPCLAPVEFDVKRNEEVVANISKLPLDLCECFKKTNRFVVDFKSITDPEERRMIFASAMLADLQYFEVNKNDS